jgi:N-acetylneuraminate synthase/N,N'-diacetyllegionaminate synthase
VSHHPFVLGERRIGPGAPIFIVAEAGVNHNGDPALAHRLVDTAAECGADAVKFQTFRVDLLVSRDAPKAGYQVETTGSRESQRDMLARLELGVEVLAALRDRATKRGLIFFSTPFDEQSADVLETLGVPLFKVPSGEITNLPLLRHLAAKGLPIILSTGMSSVEEVEQAVATMRAAGDPPLAVLHCLSAYPAPTAEVNLRAMDALATRCGCPVGFSDHTLGIEISIAAAARGACIIEKHLTLDKTLPGPDHRASLDGAEFAVMVRAIRVVETALGDGLKRAMPSELDTRRVARKSMVAARPLRAGALLTTADVVIKRPGTGVSPAELDRAIGRRLVRDVAADEVIGWEALAEP